MSFSFLSDFADLHYKVSGVHDPTDESGLLWNDSDIGIEWPSDNFIVNQRDSDFPLFGKIASFL
jgi:dTDP-4-dehydrorhamnose 3,5-epimerase